MKTLGFDRVILGLKEGKSFTRESWTDKGATIRMIKPTQIYSVPCLFPHIEYTSSWGAHLTGWTPTAWDMFGGDWMEIT